MGNKTDIAKGRVKEAAGALTDDEKLRQEGKTEQVVGKAKETIKDATESAKKAVKKAVD